MSDAEMIRAEGYRELLDSLHDAVYFTDTDRRIQFWNRQAELLTGFRADEVVGHTCGLNILRHVDEIGRCLCLEECPLSRTLADGERRSAVVYLHHRDGHRVPVHLRVAPVRGDDGAVIGAVEIFTEHEPDETLRTRIMELERLALLDPLTEIPNRRWLAQQLEGRMDGFRRYEWPFGILLLDIDLFKRVNDEHGHDVGDQMLQVVGKTLTAGARLFDSVGRWGGEEFLAIVTNVGMQRLLRIAERLRILVATSELREPARVAVTCSIGAAVVQAGDTLEDLLRRADQALYRAKDQGGNRVVC
jgi:diguanylate cyclase (GGDEF)-like protein/PAS domain S-box-containing protein